MTNNEQLTYISFCSGIEAATAAWHPLGWSPVAFCEIDKFASRVLAHHYPDVPNLGDFTKVDWSQWSGMANIVVAGWPCQDLSVAGLRTGLAGSRSGLFFNIMDAIRIIKPQWVVFENVPGLLSSNIGKDFHAVLDEIEDAGFIIDVDILDAQFFDLAQRRRRVFIVCQHRDDLLNSKTIASGLTIGQCLCETSALVLDVARGQYPTGLTNSAFAGSSQIDSLRRRIKLFAMDSPEKAQTLLPCLDVMRTVSDSEPSVLGLANGNGNWGTSKDTKPTKYASVEMGHISASRSTELSSSERLEDALLSMNECITSTPLSGITESKIYSCALLTLSITKLITRSPSSSPAFWAAASSASTALQEFTNYARQSTNSLFTDVEWIQPWCDFISQAVPAEVSLASARERADQSEVLPIGEGLRRDSAPSRTAGEGVAHRANEGVVGSLCARDSKTVGNQFVNEGKVFPVELAMCLNGGGHESD